jgi:hypothetical protein
MKFLVRERLDWRCVKRPLPHLPGKTNGIFGDNCFARSRWRCYQNAFTSINAIKSLNLEGVKLK